MKPTSCPLDIVPANLLVEVVNIVGPSLSFTLALFVQKQKVVSTQLQSSLEHNDAFASGSRHAYWAIAGKLRANLPRFRIQE